MITVFVIYGALMLAGGIFGFVKAGSKASLILGIISGVLIFAGVALLGPAHTTGRAVLTFTSFVLSGVFAIRLLKTRKFMPSGMLLTLSLLVFIFSVSQVIKK